MWTIQVYFLDAFTCGPSRWKVSYNFCYCILKMENEIFEKKKLTLLHLQIVGSCFESTSWRRQARNRIDYERPIKTCQSRYTNLKILSFFHITTFSKYCVIWEVIVKMVRFNPFVLWSKKLGVPNFAKRSQKLAPASRNTFELISGPQTDRRTDKLKWL